MSHFDTVTELAPGFDLVATTDMCNAMSADEKRKIYTTQFHPEVTNSEFGFKMIENFLFKVANLEAD